MRPVDPVDVAAEVVGRRGMDPAAGSALTAAVASNKALDSGDFSQEVTDVYISEFNRPSLARTRRPTPKCRRSSRTRSCTKNVGLLLADVFHGIYDLDLKPRRHLLNVARDALKQSNRSMTRLARIGWQAIRAL